MAVRFVRRGRGITERGVPVLARDMTAADVRDTLRFAAEAGSFEGWMREPEAFARAVLEAAGHDPDKPGKVSAEDDTSEDYAARIWQWLQRARRAIACGNASEAALAGVQIGVLVCEHDMKAEHEPSALRGKSFIDGPKRPRRDKLAELIDGAFRELGRDATADGMLNHIRDAKAVVQEVEEDRTIHWRAADGRELKTSFKAFQNRVAAQRKKFLR
jgi:hypothetical protein